MTGTESANESGFRVAVVGAGIAGLAAAICLRRQGHSVEIHERSRFNGEIGAGIGIASNVTRILHVFGMEDTSLHGVETFMNKIWYFDQVDQPAYAFPPVKAPEDKDFKNYQVHRVDLHNELKRLALSEEGIGQPCKLFLNSQVVDCDTENASITLANGDIIEADLVVVAEGIKSALRHKVCETATEPVLSGYYAHRFTIPMDESFTTDPALAWTVNDPHSINVICDAGTRRIIAYPIREEKVYNGVGICHVSEAPHLADIGANYDSIVAKEDLLKTFEGFHERYLHLLSRAPPGGIRAWPLLRVEPVTTWVKGNIVLVGDAAHPMWPYAAQGGAQGLEDAAALGVLLPKGTPVTEINSRLLLFEETRKGRCNGMQLNSFTMAEESPTARGQQRTTDHFVTALTYDAVVAAKATLAKHQLVNPIS